MFPYQTQGAMLYRSALLAASALFALSACDVSATSDADKPGVDASDDSWVRPAGPTPVAEHGALAVSGTELVDQNGTPVQLRGVSSMWLNWENDGYAENADALVWMRDHWNLSVIRAAMGIEPPGAYLTDASKPKQQVKTIVDNAIAAGVYVIVDWHAHNPHPDEAAAFFSELASQYAGVPNLIYETYNEPVQIDWPNLKSYHETVVAAIRGADPAAVIVLGTPNYSQDVDVAAGAPLAGTNLMYTLHFYSCTHGGWLIGKARKALQLGLPLFVTEWGATAADGGLDGKVCLADAATWMDFLKAQNIGWTAWKLDNCTPDSTCLLATNAPLTGGWDSNYLYGHAPFVRDAMREK